MPWIGDAMNAISIVDPRSLGRLHIVSIAHHRSRYFSGRFAT